MTRRPARFHLALALPALALLGTPAIHAGSDRLAPAPLPTTADLVPAESHALFYRLPDLYEAWLPGSARVEYRVDGKLRLAETFDLADIAPQKGSALELLAYSPDDLAALYEAAADPSRTVEVSIFLDGTVAEVFAFADLVRSNEAIRGAELYPLAVRPTMEGTARNGRAAESPIGATRGFVPDPACTAQCYSTFQGCLPHYPECADPLSFFCPCTLEYHDCVAECPLVCVDPKSVTPFTRYEAVFSWYGAVNCLWINTPSAWGYYFATRFTQVKKTTGTRTEYCNGSFSERVQSVSYQTVSCLDPGSFPSGCYPTVGGAGSVCWD